MGLGRTHLPERLSDLSHFPQTQVRAPDCLPAKDLEANAEAERWPTSGSSGPIGCTAPSAMTCMPIYAKVADNFRKDSHNQMVLTFEHWLPMVVGFPFACNFVVFAKSDCPYLLTTRASDLCDNSQKPLCKVQIWDVCFSGCICPQTSSCLWTSSPCAWKIQARGRGCLLFRAKGLGQ